MKYILLFLLSFTLLGLDQQVGLIKNVQGKVYRVTSNNRDELLNKGDAIYSGDLLNTNKGKVEVKFKDESSMTLSSKTKLSIKKFIIDNNKSKRVAIFKLIKGDLKLVVAKSFGNNLFEVNSGYISLEVKNTSFFLTNSSNNVKVAVTNGNLSVNSSLDKFNKLKLQSNKVLSVKGEATPEITGLDMTTLNIMNSKFKTFKSQESKNNNKFKSFSDGKVSSYASKYITQMRSTLKNAYVVLRKVRKEKHIMKLNCVNNSVMIIKGHLRRSEDDKTSIDEALAKNDLRSSRTLLAKVFSSYNEVKQAEISMKSCDGEVVEYEGNKNITLNVEDIIVENNYIDEKKSPMDLSFNNNSESESKVQLEPIQASPYF